MLAAVVIAAIVYGVLIGGTTAGELDPALRSLNTVLLGSLIAVYIIRSAAADLTDGLVLAGVGLIALASIGAAYPRPAFDGATVALGYAALLFTCRGLFRTPRSRIAIAVGLMAISAVVTATTAIRWLPIVLEWVARDGWRSFPPLDLPLPSIPWGHRHDVALLSAITYPAWWLAHPGLARKVVATLLLVPVALVVLLDGSRTLWLAFFVASVVVATPAILTAAQRMNRSHRTVAALLAIGMFVGLVVTGAAGSIFGRLLNFDTLSARSVMWTRLSEAWLERPIAGWGLGSFPWILQRTEYFDTNSWAPLHPDSAIFQLLAEAGILGLLALLVVGFSLGASVLRSRQRAAKWALVAFAVAAVGNNPTVFAFLVLVAVLWVAYAVPRGDSQPARRRSHVITGMTFTAFLIVAAAQVSTAVAAASYASSRRDLERDLPELALEALTTAVRWDPALALYSRQRGILELVEGNPSRAVDDLMAAAAKNPSDDLAWRALAMAYRELGQRRLADDAIETAVETQRSDPANLLLLGAWAVQDGAETRAIDALAQVVQAWPAIVVAPGWRDLVSAATFSTDDVLDRAIDRMERGAGTPAGDAVLLAVLADRQDILATIVDSDTSGVVRLAAMSYHCSDATRSAIEAAPASTRRDPRYWEAAIRDSACRGTNDQNARRMYEIMTTNRPDDGDAQSHLQPLLEDGFQGQSADRWGYDRPPLAQFSYGELLPSPAAGAALWLLDPRAAAAAWEDR